MVVMTEKESRAVRVGCGSYDWHFAPDSFLADRLSITIEVMQSLPSQDADDVMNWVFALPYKCSGGNSHPHDVAVHTDTGRVAVKLTGEGYRGAAPMDYWDGVNIDRF
jgi:hypothetical protein